MKLLGELINNYVSTNIVVKRQNGPSDQLYEAFTGKYA